jgi:hypothetical protein
MRRTPLVALAATVGVVSLLVIASTAWAKPPANDHFRNATVISSLPFSTMQDPSGATVGGEPQPTGCANEMAHTVWYQFTPSSNLGTLQADTFGSTFNTILAVYTRSGHDFTEVDCNDDGGPNGTSMVSFSAIGGTTYYFQIGACCGPHADLPPDPVLYFHFPT